MKRVINVLLLIVVCFVPFMVNAETELKYEWKINEKDFIASIDGVSYYRDDDSGDVHFHDKDGNYKGVYEINYDEIESLSSFYEDEVLFNVFKFFDDELKYNKELNKYYSVDYAREKLYVYNEDVDVDPVTYTFESNFDEIKEILGKEYDVYNSVISDGYSVYSIEMEYNYYNVYAIGIDDDSQRMLRIYNDNLDLIYEKKYDDFEMRYIARYYDNKVYEMSGDLKLNVYDLNNKLLFSNNIYKELSKIYEDYDFILENFNVKNNNLFVQSAYFLPKGMNKATINRYPSDLDNGSSARYQFFVAKFKLEYDVEAVNSNNGEFTYESKIDEYDREYIELKITPNKGYVIDKIIVTDVNGKEIEVTDNKFYMPSSDVKVEVKYVNGEYLPIPDTFLGKSTTLILIGLILVSLGVYTINYVKNY